MAEESEISGLESILLTTVRWKTELNGSIALGDVDDLADYTDLADLLGSLALAPLSGLLALVVIDNKSSVVGVTSVDVELLEGDSDNSESFSCSRRLSRGGIPTANGSSFWGVPARQRSWRSVVVADLGDGGAGLLGHRRS